VTWFSNIFLSSGNDFLPKASLLIASWKEALIFLLGIMFIWKWYKNKKFPVQFKKFDYYFLVFLGIAILSAIFITPSFIQALWGLKYDFSFLALFYLIRGFSFTEKQKNILLWTFFVSAFLVILWGSIVYNFLPKDFLLNFGYSDHVSSFNPEKPLPMYHIVGEGGTPRLASTFAGPNQFAFYLTVLISFLLSYISIHFFHEVRENILHKVTYFFQNFKNLEISKIIFFTILMLLAFYSLFFTYSRSVWLAVSVVSFVFILITFQRELRMKLVFAGIIFKVLLLIFTTFFAYEYIQDNVMRSNSSSKHFLRTKVAIEEVIQNPLGVGLGVAGPASIRFSEWDKENVSENWHIQMFQEFGWVGGIFYLLFLYNLFVYLYKKSKNDVFARGAFLALSGLVVAGVFLHSFEDSSTSLSLFLLMGLSDYE